MGSLFLLIMFIIVLILPIIAWILFFIKKMYGYACITALIAYGILFILGFVFMSSQTTIDKPILYLYPEQTQEINVKLSENADIVVSYPQYENGWNVIAEPNGDLTDAKTGRKLYALYWEEKYDAKLNSNIGFVVLKEDLVEFLEEKLAILGLNEHEAEEFIIYWLPRLEKNDSNFIHFATEDELNEIVPIEITPTPDTMIRVYMQFKAVDANYGCIEQELTSKDRVGYTSVEWGGIEL